MAYPPPVCKPLSLDLKERYKASKAPLTLTNHCHRSTYSRTPLLTANPQLSSTQLHLTEFLLPLSTSHTRPTALWKAGSCTFSTELRFPCVM